MCEYEIRQAGTTLGINRMMDVFDAFAFESEKENI